ncbi:MAG: signal peptidase I [Candidatus Lokiarchaeota archaeon]|nr:signal peptidase I [Candidatus Lokiarchaeota archaeon]
MKSATEKEKKKFLNKKVIFAIVMISVAFFGSFLVYFILQVALNTESPIVVVVSGSMEPTIHEGDLLFVKGTSPEDIKNGTAEDKDGDIIVFDARGLWIGAPEEPIVHRVIDKFFVGDIWYFRTKGDANSLPDAAPVPESNVIGVVIGGIPYIGWVKIFLTRSGLLIPLLVIISALLIISIIRDIMKGEEEDEVKDKKADEEISNEKRD